MTPAGLRARHVRGDEHQRLRELRLASLRSDPGVFGGTYEHEVTLEPGWWRRWAVESESGETQQTYVLESGDGEWSGLALVRVDSDRPRTAVLNAMWVSPQARRRGGSGLLCDACASWAAARDCEELELAVVVENIAARSAYAAAGFVISGETTWTGHGRALDELIMVRSVRSDGRRRRL